MADTDLLRGGWLDTDLPRLLRAFLLQQRWFGAKAREIRAIAVEDAVGLGDASYRCGLTVVAVGYGDGMTERYAMLLGFVQNGGGVSPIGRVESAASPTWVVESATDPRAVCLLLAGFAHSQEIPLSRGGRLLYGDCTPAAAQAVVRAAENGNVTPLGAEQSNTSVRLDGALVFKLFRRLQAGENPEVEVGRFLTTQTAFRAMPMLRGSVTYVSADGESFTVGVLQDWIDSQGDGWTHIVARLRVPAFEVPGERLDRDLFALGTTTAAFHAALASPTGDIAFAPEPITAADVKAWRVELLARLTRSRHLVERRLSEWTGETRRLGETFLELDGVRPALAGAPELLASDTCHKIRIHGDYHLGQVLRTGDGFVLIDFEGEPTRPLGERRLKHCALKDVAGMIRSFDYAVEAARTQDSHATRDGGLREHLRQVFLDGYLSSAVLDANPLLPRDRRIVDAWIDYFELEKALYEVEYEINTRPAWVWIPLRGVLRILNRRV